jgi:CO/xanthine dehydrogenase Mo-binding subunit
MGVVTHMTVLEKTSTLRAIGQSIPRLDADEKVRGLAQYADDVPVPDLWFGAAVRAPVAHGVLRGLKQDPAFDWSGICMVTPADIPGKNIVDMMGHDMPFLAFDEIRYYGEPVALVAAPTRARAAEAAGHVTVEVEERPALLTLRDVVDRFHRDRASLDLLWSQTIRKGDAETALAAAELRVEGEYWCGHQEQLYIEPQGMTAIPQPDGGMFILGSMQCPYYINPELCETLNIPPDKLRVKQTAVGGAFGGKEEFPTLLAGYCALLAMKSGKPVRMIFDRNEDILYSTKRHPAWTHHVTGLGRDGSIRSMKVEFILDGGAYTTLSPVVLYRGILHAAMGYRCDHVSVDGYVYRTHTFPNGAFRGFGAPQSIWGLESHVDEMAAVCGLPPHEFRRKNCLVLGDTTPTGQVLRESVGSPAVLEETLKRSRFSEKFARCSRGRAERGRWYGIGVSFFAHGSGFTGDGEARIKAKVALDLDFFEDGRPGVNVRVSSTEMGQGTFTILPQVAADGLRIGIARVRCPYPDTALVPDSGPTVASRTAMVVGNTVFGAGARLRRDLEAFAAKALFNGQPVELEEDAFRAEWGGPGRSFEEVAAIYLKQHGPLRVYNQFALPSTIRWNQKTFEGDAYPAYSWGCNVAEVEIDELTCEPRVTRVAACYDIGRVLNPMLAKGQIEGGLVQALGYAVMEKIRIKNGRYDADRMQTYIVPTALDVPELDIHFVEFPYEHAWPGAKGVGEIPMDGLAPAVANAIQQAIGIRIREIPITAESIYEALHAPAGVGRDA